MWSKIPFKSKSNFEPLFMTAYLVIQFKLPRSYLIPQTPALLSSLRKTPGNKRNVPLILPLEQKSIYAYDGQITHVLSMKLCTQFRFQFKSLFLRGIGFWGVKTMQYAAQIFNETAKEKKRDQNFDVQKSTLHFGLKIPEQYNQ